jgi:hypothetical protein
VGVSVVQLMPLGCRNTRMQRRVVVKTQPLGLHGHSRSTMTLMDLVGVCSLPDNMWKARPPCVCSHPPQDCVKAGVCRVLVTCHLLLRQHTQAANYSKLAGEAVQPVSRGVPALCVTQASSPASCRPLLMMLSSAVLQRLTANPALACNCDRHCDHHLTESFQPGVVATSFLRFNLALLQVNWGGGTVASGYLNR